MPSSEPRCGLESWFFRARGQRRNAPRKAHMEIIHLSVSQWLRHTVQQSPLLWSTLLTVSKALVRLTDWLAGWRTGTRPMCTPVQNTFHSLSTSLSSRYDLFIAGAQLSRHAQNTDHVQMQTLAALSPVLEIKTQRWTGLQIIDKGKMLMPRNSRARDTYLATCCEQLPRTSHKPKERRRKQRKREARRRDLERKVTEEYLIIDVKWLFERGGLREMSEH